MKLPIGNQRQLLGGLGKTGAWFAGARLVQILAGLWVTRILDPQDFAILAIIFAVQGFIQQLTALNFTSELVRSSSISQEDTDCAWSYEVIRNVFIWLLLITCAPMAAGWMGHPEASSGLRLSASGMLLACFRNPRLVELRRAGRFGRLGWIEAIPMVAYAMFSVWFVSFSPNYLSLIYAGLASSCCGVIATYGGLPWRPRFNFEFARIRPMLGFGMFLLLGTGLFALREHGIVFVASAAGHAHDLGYLNRGIAFSMALVLQAIGIFWRVAYPHYAAVHREGGNAPKDAVMAFRWLLILGLPTAVAIACFSEPIISLTFGEKWQPVAAVWGWLVISGSLMLANAPLEAALQAVRREKIQISISAISTFVSLGIAWILLPQYGLAGVGIAACVSNLLATILLGWALTRTSCRAAFAASEPQL